MNDPRIILIIFSIICFVIGFVIGKLTERKKTGDLLTQLINFGVSHANAVNVIRRFASKPRTSHEPEEWEQARQIVRSYDSSKSSNP